LLKQIKLPLAFQGFMLGLNQIIMLALFMLVTVLVGTRDFGQEVFTALQRGDTGLGVIAGLSSVSDEFGPKYSGIAMPETKRKRNG
jgi:glycine betaine/proline transport system permease protein